MDVAKQQLTAFKMQRAFNLILILFLVTLAVISLDVIRNRVKDTKRRADVTQLQKALNMYQLRFGNFPQVKDDDFNGWDASIEPIGERQQFLDILLSQDIIDKEVRDPVNSITYYYRYKKFPAGSFGCLRPFYVLQVMNFEGSHDDHGWGDCPERDFVAELPNGYTIQIFE